MFLNKEDLGVAIYGYQLEQITEGNDSIVTMAMAAAQEEARSYLTANNSKDYLDGRFVYDTQAIFSATGSDRNPLILQHCITLAKWHIVQLSNVDILYEQIKERYDRATDWLTKLAEGEINLSTLPTVNLSEDTTKQPFAFGSRAKFNHDY
ncbi:phage protein Gp36 family protein [Aquimarina algiphila]|uniref:phage protein Gp36 family protein n=1 Tax=Aquimarina algiphila TaxID=2047982 RepID=UPI0023309095|nr:phage protein Gp36 family protein [Aquimarina algiphila]